MNPNVRLRPIQDDDLPVLFAHQADPEGAAMAGFPSRDPEAFAAHWAKVRADPATLSRAVLVDDVVAGNIGSWPDDGQQLLGYWIGREYWGRGVASRAVALLIEEVPVRPLIAHVAEHNAASMRVLEKCGFCRERSADDPGEWAFVLDRVAPPPFGATPPTGRSTSPDPNGSGADFTSKSGLTEP